MRIAIAYPPLKSEKGVALLTQNRQFQWFSRPTYIFPVVPATAATMLKKAGHEVLFLDGIASELSPEAFDSKLAAFKPDLVVLETKTPVVKRHWKWIAEHDYKSVLVGDHVTALPEESIEKPGVWAIIPGGDWDYGLLDFIAAGCPKGVQPFALKDSIADAPWIDRDLVHWELYAEKNGNFRRKPGTYIMSGRDCWHGKCTFCSWTTLYPRYRVRKVKDVVDEIEMLVSKYGVKEIMDDSGSFPVGQWLTDFCNEMISRGLPKKVRIDCNMRFGRLTLADYRLMRKAGFQFVREPGDPRPLLQVPQGRRRREGREVGDRGRARRTRHLHVRTRLGGSEGNRQHRRPRAQASREGLGEDIAVHADDSVSRNAALQRAKG